MSKLFKQGQIEHCKAVCRGHFENLQLNVSIDEPIATEIEWAPHVHARNDQQYGIDIRTEPTLESFWLDTYLTNVRPVRPALKICLAFPFDVALRLSFETLTSFIKSGLAIIVVYDDTLKIFGDQIIGVPSRLANSIIHTLRKKKADQLSQSLLNCPRGWSYYSEYEKICLDIFETLFVPPLSKPYTQSPTASHLRRRDHVFPNHARQGFWFEIIKQTYKGHYVLLECKNLRKRISVSEVDDAAKYLNCKGIGLFGLIFSRIPANPQAELLQISNWKDNNKLTIIIDDTHLLEMIEMYANQQDPSEIIQREIDNFMLKVV